MWYSNAYIFVKGTTANNAANQTDEKNKRVIFKNCVPFTYCIME